MRRVSGEAFWIALCAGILAWKLLLPGFIGMADNGDFGRVAAPLCLAAADTRHDNFFNSLYLRTQANCFPARVPTSALILAGFASAVERTVSDPTRFDIRWLGALYGLIFLAFFHTLLTLIRPLGALARFALTLLALWIFADVGLLAYFNSFFSDTTAVLGGLIATALAVRLLDEGTAVPFTTIAFGVAALLATTSKAPRVVFGLVATALALAICRRSTNRRGRWLAAGTAVTLLAGVTWIVMTTPAWYQDQTRFDVVFGKILTNSPAPASDLVELGLDAGDTRYIGLNSYIHGGPMDTAWAEQFAVRCTGRRLIAFYLRHPGRTFAILSDNLNHIAWQRRDPELSNFTRQSGRPEGALATSLGSWSAFRTWESRKWPWLMVVWLLFAPLAALFRCTAGARFRRALAWTALGVAAAALGEFAIASLADSVEIPRHLLMFHVFSDLSIFFGLVLVASLLESACPLSFRRPAAILAAAGLAMFIVMVGKYEIAAAAPPPTPHTEDLPPDAVDDANQAVVYSGSWDTGAFASAFHGTLTFSDRTGAAARYTFQGVELEYVYTKAPNRGMALVSIDGSPLRTIDLYSPQIVWQVRAVFGNLKPGPHQVEIQVLGRHTFDSSGNFVDVDAFASR